MCFCAAEGKPPAAPTGVYASETDRTYVVLSWKAPAYSSKAPMWYYIEKVFYEWMSGDIHFYGLYLLKCFAKRTMMVGILKQKKVLPFRYSLNPNLDQTIRATKLVLRKSILERLMQTWFEFIQPYLRLLPMQFR